MLNTENRLIHTMKYFVLPILLLILLVLTSANRVSAAQTLTARITSRTRLNTAVTIFDSQRNDWTLNAPAYTTSSSMNNHGFGASYNNQSVTALEADLTQRSNGNSYTYIEVRTSNGRTFWIDQRAILSSISSQTAVSYGATIQQAGRQDGVFANGPALSSWSSATASGQASNYVNDHVAVIREALTNRGNGLTYRYLQVQDHANTFWLDARAVSRTIFDRITQRQTGLNRTAHIDASRNDTIEFNGPIYTSSSTMLPDAQSSNLAGHQVTVSEIDSTSRTSGGTYHYAKVYDTVTRRSYWIDTRSLTYTNYDQITAQSNDTSDYAEILNRSDWLETAGPASTSADTAAAHGYASSYAGDLAQVQTLAATRSSSGLIRYYAKIYIPAANRTFWVNRDSLSISKYATARITTANENAKVADDSRNDGTFTNGPALTSANTLLAAAGGHSYDGDLVVIQSRAVTTRANGMSYTYDKVYDQTRRITYWIDARALASRTMNGYDISSYQTGIDNGRVSGSFVIVKATQGTNYSNPAMSTEANSALRAGKQLGFYHYAETGSAVAQADDFVRAVQPFLADHPLLALDWEDAAVSQGPAWAKSWLDEVYRQTHVRPLIYMSKSVTNAWNWQTVSPNYGLWVAQYATNASTGYDSDPWTDSNPFGSWATPTIFQYSSHGSLSGYSGALDLDLFYGDFEDWHRLAGLTN